MDQNGRSWEDQFSAPGAVPLKTEAELWAEVDEMEERMERSGYFDN